MRANESEGLRISVIDLGSRREEGEDSLHLGVSDIRGTLHWGPYNKDPTIEGTILGCLIFGNFHIGAFIGSRTPLKGTLRVLQGVLIIWILLFRVLC